MPDEQTGLSAAIAAAAAAMRSRHLAHVPIERLIAYHEGRSDEAERDEIQEHLSLCQACTRLVLDLAAFPALEPLGEAFTDEQVAQEFGRIEQALRTKPKGESGTGRRFALPRWAYAIAAMWLLGTCALGAWISTLRARLVVLSQPQVNIAVSDLSPLDDTVRDVREAWRSLSFSPGQREVLLALHTADSPALTSYQAELLRAKDGESRVQRIWTETGIQVNADGLCTLRFPREFLPAGSYRLLLTSPGAPALQYAFVVLP